MVIEDKRESKEDLNTMQMRCGSSGSFGGFVDDDDSEPLVPDDITKEDLRSDCQLTIIYRHLPKSVKTTLRKSFQC